MNNPNVHRKGGDDDIVGRLRSDSEWLVEKYGGPSPMSDDVTEAADEIERLRIVLENVRQFVTYAGAGMSDPTVAWAAQELCDAFDRYASHSAS